MITNLNTRSDSQVDSRAERNGFSVIELLFVAAIIVTVVALLLPATRRAGPQARRSQCMHNLKQIAFALQNYESDYQALPPAYTVDANGKPLHSWRTLILPYLDNEQLYKTIDLSKAWDDPANADVCKAMPIVFKCPEANCPIGHTTYLAIVAPRGCFCPTESRVLSEITDDRSKTLMVIEVSSAHAVPWMAPIDADEHAVLGFGPKTALAHTGGMNAAYVDGHIELVEAKMPAAERRSQISIAGND